MGQIFDVVIIGAGASGLTAGIHAAREGADVLILEHMDKAGKKILATGNGKCNFTNEKQGIAYYRGKNPAFVLPALEQFGLAKTLHFFRELGIYAKPKRDGYYYPSSGQAASVLEVLLMECRRLNVTIEYGIGIRGIQKKDGKFLINTKQGILKSLSCVIATGGKAAKKTGSDGSGIPYIVGFGHKMTDLAPALVGLQGKQPFLKDLAGIRAECNVTLYIENKKIAEDLGELQLTEFGVSGIPVFQVSRYAAYGLLQKQQVSVKLNFLPGLSQQQVEGMLAERFFSYGEGKTAQEALVGLLPAKLNQVLLKESGIDGKKPAKACSGAKLTRLAHKIQSLLIEIIGTKGFDGAQATAGGVDTDEICPDTMESRLVPGLFFSGEVIDIDGMCGGYNLQWAWSSGFAAGKSAAGYASNSGQKTANGGKNKHDTNTSAKAPGFSHNRTVGKENLKDSGHHPRGTSRIPDTETIHRCPKKR